MGRMRLRFAKNGMEESRTGMRWWKLMAMPKVDVVVSGSRALREWRTEMVEVQRRAARASLVEMYSTFSVEVCSGLGSGSDEGFQGLDAGLWNEEKRTFAKGMSVRAPSGSVTSHALVWC